MKIHTCIPLLVSLSCLKGVQFNAQASRTVTTTCDGITVHHKPVIIQRIIHL